MADTVAPGEERYSGTTFAVVEEVGMTHRPQTPGMMSSAEAAAVAAVPAAPARCQPTAATHPFCSPQDHTLANALRFFLNKK